MADRIAILAGDGSLPVLLSMAMPDAVCVVFKGMPHQLHADFSLVEARLEKLGELFEVLKSEAKKINFHIHDWEFGNILLQGEGTIIWVCNH